MSGGHFNYDQYRLEDIATAIDELIKSNTGSDTNEYGDAINRNYSAKTIELFEQAAQTLRHAGTMAQRIDWLVSGDDSEESFHKRWKEEVGENE